MKGIDSWRGPGQYWRSTVLYI
jgi:hypothetical protein